jgi:hypothetical protein
LSVQLAVGSCTEAATIVTSGCQHCDPRDAISADSAVVCVLLLASSGEPRLHRLGREVHTLVWWLRVLSSAIPHCLLLALDDEHRRQSEGKIWTIERQSSAA